MTLKIKSVFVICTYVKVRESCVLVDIIIGTVLFLWINIKVVEGVRSIIQIQRKDVKMSQDEKQCLTLKFCGLTWLHKNCV